MREHRVGERGIAIGDLEPDAVALLEHVGAGQHLDVELIDLARTERLRIGVGVERPQRVERPKSFSRCEALSQPFDTVVKAGCTPFARAASSCGC